MDVGGAKFPNRQGMVVGWNYSSSGCGHFMCNKGGGNGGFRWFNTTSLTIGSSLSDYTKLADLDHNGNFWISGATATKASGTTWANPCDKRLKSNIEDANTQTCYDIMKELKLKRFTMSGKVDDRNQVGFIAQDVENIFPKAVKTNKGSLPDGTKVDDLRTLDTDQIYKTMYGTIQHLMKKVEDLEAKISQLSQ